MQSKCIHNLCAPRNFYLHAQTAVHVSNIRTWRTTIILITEKPEDPQFEPHAGIKMVEVLGSLVYICGYPLPFIILVLFVCCSVVALLCYLQYQITCNICPRTSSHSWTNLSPSCSQYQSNITVNIFCWQGNTRCRRKELRGFPIRSYAWKCIDPT